MLSKILLAFAVLFTLSCTSFQSKMKNDRNFNASEFKGNKVFIKVVDIKGTDISNNIDGKNLTYEVKHWLNTNGRYSFVETQEQSNIMIVIGVLAKNKILNIPAQSYVTPIYNNSGTTTTVKDNYGNTLGTLESASSNPYAPSGYTTNYRAAYSAEVTERVLMLTVLNIEPGKTPNSVSEGGATPEDYGQGFFEDTALMKQAINDLLRNSVLAK